MADTYLPPAGLTDFDQSENHRQELFDKWHARVAEQMRPGQDAPAFFDSLKPPEGAKVEPATPAWNGLPRFAKLLARGDLVRAAELVEQPRRLGDIDPIGDDLPEIRDVATGALFQDARYRPQDEYLEWVAIRDADGVISEILFTCEAPEYWSHIAAIDKALLISLYRSLIPAALKNEFNEDDLFFPRDVNFGTKIIRAGTYNPYNRWNARAAIHLTQRANSLGAEINLARDASRLYGTPTVVTTDPALVCCGGYGAVNRMSDPTIGATINKAVRDGRMVSLRNPVGLYMQRLPDFERISVPGNGALSEADAAEYFVPERMSKDGEMVVRARFRVPDGVLHQGKQVRVGDLQVDGARVITGGQVADTVTIQIFALVLPKGSAPKQTPQACASKPCPHPTVPGMIVPSTVGKPCKKPETPASGPVNLLADLGLAKGDSLSAEAPDLTLTSRARATP